MIAAIAGSVNARYRQGDRRLMEVETTGGLSYEVQVPPSVWEQEGEVSLSVHHHITEASQALYGFSSREERGVFRVLLSVSGVGPAIALALMSLGSQEVVRAIVREDAKALSAAKGVGLAIAKRICLDAKKKFKDVVVEEGGVEDDEVALEVEVVLKAMGYRVEEVKSALVAVKGIEDADEAVKVAIASLMEV